MTKLLECCPGQFTIHSVLCWKWEMRCMGLPYPCLHEPVLQRPTPWTTEDKDAARNAARAAAAAAADACGVCGALHGEEPELDGIWICCDFCNRCELGLAGGAAG